MKYWIILLAFPMMSATDCGKKNKTAEDKTSTDAVPACIRKVIDDATKAVPTNTPVQVDEYNYEGKKVYLVTAHCCDQYNVLYDEQCKMLCAPTGGYTGKGDGKCPGFQASATHVKTIWKDDKQ